MPDFTLSYAFLIEAGEHTDAFMLQYILGHDTINRCVMCSLGWSQAAERSGSEEEAVTA
jgi:hypothetical protein